MDIAYMLLQNLQDFLDPFLQRLDPALFQNIILGILTIFIPFALVFLTDILNSKKEKKSEFEKMVLSDEVLGTQKVFWLSIFGIVFFAFFSGVETSTPAKIVAIIVAIFLVFLFWKHFKKILRFSEGYKPEFEIPFLKKLRFSKIFRFRNKSKAEKIFRSWNSFWSEKSGINERDFTNIFISHIDDAIKFKKFDLAVALGYTYVTNIEKRDPSLIGNDILPKILEWHEIFWNEEKTLHKHDDTEKKIQKTFFSKFFLRFGDLMTKFFKKQNSRKQYFWNWHYFGGDFFQAIIKTLLKDRYCSYQLFESFKKHIKYSQNELEKITDEKEKVRNWQYITCLFSSFCPTFFNEINSVPSNYGIWDHYFPPEWKITIANKDNRIARIIFREFFIWAKDRILKNKNDKKYDKVLNDVINGIFPNLKSTFFYDFLILSSFSINIQEAIKKGVDFMYFGYVTVDVEDSQDETINIEDESIDIILEFFRPRKENLDEIKAELESEKIIKFCEDSKFKESNRKGFLLLFELLTSRLKVLGASHKQAGKKKGGWGKAFSLPNKILDNGRI
jgi:hypothetical protein